MTAFGMKLKVVTIEIVLFCISNYKTVNISVEHATSFRKSVHRNKMEKAICCNVTHCQSKWGLLLGIR